MYDKYFTEEHEEIRSITRRFVEREITPFVNEWEEAGNSPRYLYEKAAAVGILGIGYPEEFGGVPLGLFGRIAVWEEMLRCGAGGVVASLNSLHIALPPIRNHGTDAQKERFLIPVLTGKKIAALGITEPGAGSDVANLRTTAVRNGDHYIVNGSKTFITNGSQADQVTLAVRTGGEGHGGISLLIVEKGMPGFSASKPLKKMGWLSSDTAALFFDECRVPVGNLIGEENHGFPAIMENFQNERLMLAVMANMAAQMALEESLRYVQEREAFGRVLVGFQTIRHKLVEMATQVEVSREFTYRVAAKMAAGEEQVTQVSMAKIFSCQVSDFVTDAAVQIFGGYGYMREYLVERLYRDNRILSIGGGTTEIMREIISRRIL